MQVVVELPQGHHAGLAAVALDAKDLKNVNEILGLLGRFVFDLAHLLEQAIEMAQEASTGRALDVGVHCLIEQIRKCQYIQGFSLIMTGLFCLNGSFMRRWARLSSVELAHGQLAVPLS
jgi:hypothetical protein